MSDSYFSLHVHPLLWGLLLILYVKGVFTFAYVLKMQKQQNGLFNMKQNERVLIKIVIENKIIIGFRAKKKSVINFINRQHGTSLTYNTENLHRSVVQF